MGSRHRSRICHLSYPQELRSSSLVSPRLTPRATPREIVYPGRQGQEGQELGSLPPRVTIEAVGAGPSGDTRCGRLQQPLGSPLSPRDKFRNRGKSVGSNKTSPSVGPPVVPLVEPRADVPSPEPQDMLENKEEVPVFI